MGDIDEGQMLIKFANGKLGTLEVSRNANGIMDVRTEVVGTRQSVYIGQTQSTPVTRVKEKGIFQDMVPSCLERFDRAYENEIIEFIKNVKNGYASPVDAVDGLKGLKLALAAKQSLHSKVAVKIG